MSVPTSCPDCGGEIYDNRKRKESGKMSPKAPDFACKDKEDCKWVQWPPREKKSANGANKSTAPRNTTPLGPLYRDCLDLAVKILAKQFPMGGRQQPTIEHALNAAATLFIAASRDGTPLVPPKPAPKPEPEPESPYIGDNLPF